MLINTDVGSTSEKKNIFWYKTKVNDLQTLFLSGEGEGKLQMTLTLTLQEEKDVFWRTKQAQPFPLTL